MKKTRKILAVLLALVMVVGMLPASALALEGAEEKSLAAVQNGTVTVVSPDGSGTSISVWIENGVPYYSVENSGTTLIEPSCLGIETSIGSVTDNVAMGEITTDTHDEIWDTIVGEKTQVRDWYNSAIIPLIGDGITVTLEVRAYPEGVAFRYLLPTGEYTIAEDGEQTEFTFPSLTYATLYIQNNQVDPIWSSTESFAAGANYRYPSTVEYVDGKVITLCEADVDNYSTAALVKNTDKNRSLTIKNSSAIYVDAGSPDVTPWRAFVIGEELLDLPENSDLILNLNEAPDEEIYNFDEWVEAGTCLRANVSSTDTVKARIDECVTIGASYCLMDTGWYGPEMDKNMDPRLDPSKLDLTNSYDAMLATAIPEEGVFRPNGREYPTYGLFDGSFVEGWPKWMNAGTTDLNIPEICEYANSKGVGIILYVNGRHLPDQTTDENGNPRNRYTVDELFEYFERWGVAGVKPGFVASRTQEAEAYMQEVCEAAAAHGLVMTVHDEWLSCGLERTYPNLLNYEAILGDEGAYSAAGNINTLFTRMIQGVADHTYNTTKFTKAFTAASAVVFRGNLQCLFWATAAVSGKQVIDAWTDLPANWDESLYLEGKMNSHATYARRSGDQWYIAGINAEPHFSSISLDFLEPGETYLAEIFNENYPKTGMVKSMYYANSETILGTYLKNPMNGYIVRLTKLEGERDAAIADYDANVYFDQLLEGVNAMNGEPYTAQSWAQLQSAIEKATALALKGNPAQKEAAALEIDAAIDALVNITPLKDELAKTTTFTNFLYTAESWDAVKAAVKQAKTALAKEDLTYEEMLKATEDIIVAVNGLEKSDVEYDANEQILTELGRPESLDGDYAFNEGYEDSENLELFIDGEQTVFTNGLAARDANTYTYDISGLGYDTIECYVGNDANLKSVGGLVFYVYGDGALLYSSLPNLKGSDDAQFISVPISGVKKLELVQKIASPDWDNRGVWADIKLLSHNAIECETITTTCGEAAEVSVSYNGEREITSVRFTIDSALPISAITAADGYDIENNNGYVIVYKADGSNISGKLLTIEYDLDISPWYANGEYPVELTVVDASDGDAEDINIGAEDGMIVLDNDYMAGDTDLDGSVTNADVIALARYLVELVEFNEEQLIIADVDGSGEINNSDLIKLVRKIVEA